MKHVPRIAALTARGALFVAVLSVFSFAAESGAPEARHSFPNDLQLPELRASGGPRPPAIQLEKDARRFSCRGRSSR